jgi:hydrogenase/urease accessory protein HupE
VRRRLFLLGLGSFLLFATPLPGTAHELIPRSVQEYIEDNPDATPDEIEQFIQGNAPGLSEKARDQAELVRLVKERDTTFLDNAFDFLVLGVKHILSGPDHILFVLSLLLVFISLRKVLVLTSAFTLAHSLTLILAGTETLTLSSRIVEPVIALSISAVALSSVFLRGHPLWGNFRVKVGIVFFFGLFHGLGFAGLLKEIRVPEDKFVSSLASFNLGIELGQLLIVAAALPLIYTFKEKSWYGQFIKALAILIALMGIFWAIERALG